MKSKAAPMIDDDDNKGAMDFSNLTDWSVTNIATDPHTSPEEQAAAMAEIKRRQETNSFELNENPEQPIASVHEETEESEVTNRQQALERGAKLNKQIRDFYQEQTDILENEAQDDEIAFEAISRKRPENTKEFARREQERNKATNQYKEMRRGARALRKMVSDEEHRDEALNKHIIRGIEVESDHSMDVDQSPIVIRKAQKLARTRFDRDYVRGAMDFIDGGFLEATPEQIYLSGFHTGEDYKFKDNSTTKVPDAYRDIDDVVLIPELSTKTSEQIKELEKRAILTSLAAGACYEEWRDLDRPPKPHFFIPIRKDAKAFSEFIVEKGINPKDEDVYELSLHGFINTLEAIKFNQLKGQDDEFAELNWYFDQFDYGDEDNLEDLINVIQSHEQDSDRFFVKKADEFLQQRPEFISYRAEKEANAPGLLIEIAKNAELYKFDDLMNLFNVEILPDGTILTKDRRIGNINKMGLLGEMPKDDEESDIGADDNRDENSDNSEELLDEVEKKKALPRLTGEEKTDRFIRFCIWMDRNVEENPDCYLTKVTATRGGGMTRYAGVRFGLSDIQTNNILFESLDDTQDAAFSARGRTGTDANGLINMLAHGTRTEIARRPDVMKHDHRAKGDIRREERVYHDAWFLHFRKPFENDLVQDNMRETSAGIEDVELKAE